jgi:hypothetical protein
MRCFRYYPGDGGLLSAIWTQAGHCVAVGRLRATWACVFSGRNQDSRAWSISTLLHRILLGGHLLHREQKASVHDRKARHCRIDLWRICMDHHDVRGASTFGHPQVANLEQSVDHYRAHRPPFSRRIADRAGRQAVGSSEVMAKCVGLAFLMTIGRENELLVTTRWD